MTEWGAVSDNGIAVERLEAPGPSPRARASSPDAPADPSSGSVRGLASPWRLPALHPLMKRGKETGKRATPGPGKQTTGAAERWLNRLFENRIRFARNFVSEREADALHPPLEGEGREPTGPCKARPDDKLRERGGVSFVSAKKVHPTPPPPGEGEEGEAVTPADSASTPLRLFGHTAPNNSADGIF